MSESRIGFSVIDYPAAAKKEVNQALAVWRSFCALPESERAHIGYDTSSSMGVGYELKKGGDTLDAKEDFHFTLGSRDWLMNAAGQNNTVHNLIHESSALIETIRPIVESYSLQVEKEYGLVGFAEEVMSSKDLWFIRYLHYFGGRSAGEEIAAPHADKSGFTLHLHESAPGLQYLDESLIWKEMPVAAHQTAVIPGMRLQYRSANKIKATFHRVVATDQTAEIGRFSAVCFIHLNKTPAYDKAKAGRIQGFAPGFNYSMPWDQFRMLFS